MSLLNTQDKYHSLCNSLKKYHRLAVAFSGGVDSTLLYHAACDAIDKGNVFVLRGVSELIALQEQESAVAVLDAIGALQENRVEVVLHPLIWPEFVVNTPDRCYFCKKRMYKAFLLESERKECAALLDGTNVDDLKSGRPGLRAIHELRVQTPLLDAGLSKGEIRSLAADFHLPNHDKPSNSCLATRIPEGTGITEKNLQMVGKWEAFLSKRGFIGCRARVEGRDVVLQLMIQDSDRLLSKSLRVELLHFMQMSGFDRILFDLTPRD